MEESTDVEAAKESSVADEQETSNFWRLDLKLKILLFIICFSGFTYQVEQYLSLYFSYPTIRGVKVESNKEFILPALTYCYFKSATRNKFCIEHPEDCKKAEGEDCEIYPDYCRNGYMIPKLDALGKLKDGDLEEFKDLNVTIHNFMFSNPWGIPNSDVSGPYYAVPWNSYNVSVCFTMNSRVNSSKEPMKWRNDDPKLDSYDNEKYFSGSWLLDLQSIVYNERKIDHSVAVSVHSPFDVSLPEKEKAFKPETRYELSIRMEEANRLLPPYGTECTDYTLEWEKKNRTGPRSQKSCRNVCEIEYDVACFKCVNVWNLFPTEERRCIQGFNLDGNDGCNETIKKKFEACLDNCKIECSGLIEVDIFMETQSTVYTHRPQIQRVEVFSAIGGYLGIWLGISLFALIDILRAISDFLQPMWEKIADAKQKKDRSNDSIKKTADEESNAKKCCSC